MATGTKDFGMIAAGGLKSGGMIVGGGLRSGVTAVGGTVGSGIRQGTSFVGLKGVHDAVSGAAGSAIGHAGTGLNFVGGAVGTGLKGAGNVVTTAVPKQISVGLARLHS